MLLYKLLRAAMHTSLLFVLPWLVGAFTAAFFDVSEVTESGGQFLVYFAWIATPLLLSQLIAVAVKVRRDRRALRLEGKAGFAATVEALDRHARVLTSRGLSMLAASLLMVVVALSAKWAQFGVLAIAGLGLVYLLATVATLVSAFTIRAFDDRVRRGRGRIDRELVPSVVDAGDAVDETFHLANVPVPPAFRLHIEDTLPARLSGETRFAVDRSVSSVETEASAPLPRTPRGVFRVGPATIWYEDIFGLTRVRVAAHACATLRVLPRVRPVLLDRRPTARSRAEGPLSALSRIATDDLYRARPYVAGDDLRRVHWKLSINTGVVSVRVPESVPFAPRDVRLVLDTYLPPSLFDARERLEDALDRLVEGWVSLAHALVLRGERVTCAVAVEGKSGVELRELVCRRGEERRWRAVGAEAAWQSKRALPELLADGARKGESSIVVTGGLGPIPPLSVGAVVILAEVAALLPKPVVDATPLAERIFTYRYPVGAEDNRVDWRAMGARLRRTKSDATLDSSLARAASLGASAARGAGAQLLVLRTKGPALSLEQP